MPAGTFYFVDGFKKDLSSVSNNQIPVAYFHENWSPKQTVINLMMPHVIIQLNALHRTAIPITAKNAKTVVT